MKSYVTVSSCSAVNVAIKDSAKALAFLAAFFDDMFFDVDSAAVVLIVFVPLSMAVALVLEAPASNRHRSSHLFCKTISHKKHLHILYACMQLINYNGNMKKNEKKMYFL
ncbi:hypothetical protein [Bacillus atrophaeus]|uniref:hypothetical protein n=1 Tax=Bacillus atrophaeus TaxID=1452 RepID=UPI002E1C5246|nr:hypothetical protein [Bacillus atrophaeus]